MAKFDTITGERLDPPKPKTADTKPAQESQGPKAVDTAKKR